MQQPRSILVLMFFPSKIIHTRSGKTVGVYTTIGYGKHCMSWYSGSGSSTSNAGSISPDFATSESSQTKSAIPHCSYAHQICAQKHNLWSNRTFWQLNYTSRDSYLFTWVVWYLTIDAFWKKKKTSAFKNSSINVLYGELWLERGLMCSACGTADKNNLLLEFRSYKSDSYLKSFH